MTFRLKQHESVNKGIKRIIHRQLDKAVVALTSEKRDAVHDIRVHFKKVRACLRLMRGELGSELYRRENRRFRDAAQPLRQMRDAEVLVKTLERLGADDISGIRQGLEDRRRAVPRPEMERLAKTVKTVQGRLENWHLKEKDWPLLERGLKHSWRKNCRAFTEAKRHPTVENLHEWRKQAKYLWYQLLPLERAWPKGIKAMDTMFYKLTQALGEMHDLGMLRQTLTTDAETFGNSETLLPLIDRRREKLQQKALTLGERLYRKKPRKLLRTIEKHWKSWHR